jgi:hypothetical protein
MRVLASITRPNTRSNAVGKPCCWSKVEDAVLFMSGYTENAAVHRDLTPGAAFL